MLPVENRHRSLDQQQLRQFELASQRAARMGGEVLMKLMGKAEHWKKGPGDWVTQADFESQQVIREELLNQFPRHDFLGEETETDIAILNDQSPAEFCWIVDPLDGTTNFVHQLRSFAVSVAVVQRDRESDSLRILAGTVFDPTTNECFSAILGGGATLNGSPIQVSQCQTLNDALTVHSMSSRVSPHDSQIKRLINVMGTSATVRRLGSAALNLCYVACGRVDAYWAANLCAWDVAAGWLIAEESGAVIADFDHGPLQIMQPKFCCSATQILFDELQPLLNINSPNGDNGQRRE